jgi:hypothetical protein
LHKDEILSFLVTKFCMVLTSKSFAYRLTESVSPIIAGLYDVHLNGVENIPLHDGWVGPVFPHLRRPIRPIFGLFTDQLVLAGAIPALRKYPFPMLYAVTPSTGKLMQRIHMPHLVAAGKHIIPNDEDRNNLNRTRFHEPGLEALRRGGIVMGYPNARFNNRDEFPFAADPIRAGLFAMAQEAGKPIVPVSFFTTHDYWQHDRIKELGRPQAFIDIGRPTTIPFHPDDHAKNKAERDVVIEACKSFYQVALAATGYTQPQQG